MSAARPSRSAAGDDRLQWRFQVLRSLLKKNSTALRMLADLEADLAYVEPYDERIQGAVARLWDEALLMAEELELLTGGRHRGLYPVLEQIGAAFDQAFRDAVPPGARPLSVRLADEPAEDPRIVGGKAAGLRRLSKLHPEHVPDCFVITTEAYRQFIDANALFDRVRPLLSDIDVIADRDQFGIRTRAIREMIRQAETPREISDAIAARAAEIGAPDTRWAVRSSARSEDERFTFAGQFETLLDVPTADLDRAYRAVLAGRFTDRAVLYRACCNFRDVDTPMAVVFMPMIDVRAAGVIYTLDPQDREAERMVATMVPGLSDRMLRGEQTGETVYLSRRAKPHILPVDGKSAAPDYVPEPTLEKLAAIALTTAEEQEREMDLEWALDRDGNMWLLQGRELHFAAQLYDRGRSPGSKAPPLIEGGVTIAPGRAEGPLEHLGPHLDGGVRSRAPVVRMLTATPDITTILPSVAAVLVVEGNPAGHAAAVMREFSVPALFQVGPGAALLREGETVSVDASRHQVFRGSRWEGIRERVLSRIASAQGRGPVGPLHDLVLALNLTDPYGSGFKPRNCQSVHDVIRYIHEMSIRSMFQLGDRQNRFWSRRARKLALPLPSKTRLIDMDETNYPGRGEIKPESVPSVPFQAFWRGVSAPGVDWSERWINELDGMPPAFVDSIMATPNEPRRRRDDNYIVVASDYLNLNARMTFHYAMIDAVVRPGKESNHVHFRARGGGADDQRRALRARFLEMVLRHHRFMVDRKGDLVSGWLRGYPQPESEEALEMLGRLLACNRRLDMSMADERSPRHFMKEFLAGNYAAFSRKH